MRMRPRRAARHRASAPYLTKTWSNSEEGRISMSDRRLYRLSDSTVVEPLVNRWSAWSHLISPVPGSLHLLHYQIKLLRSYLKDPNVHVNACRDAKLRSGTLVDIPAERASEVEDFLSNTEIQAVENIKLAKAI